MKEAISATDSGLKMLGSLFADLFNLANSPEQFIPTCPQCAADSGHNIKPRIRGTRFDTLNVPPVNLGPFRQIFLRQIFPLPDSANITA